MDLKCRDCTEVPYYMASPYIDLEDYRELDTFREYYINDLIKKSNEFYELSQIKEQKMFGELFGWIVSMASIVLMVLFSIWCIWYMASE